MCPSEVNELEMESSNLYSHVFRGESIGNELGSYEHEGRDPVMAVRGHRGYRIFLPSDAL